MPDSLDLAAIGLTLRLAGTTTLLLLIVGTPLAWWLARTRPLVRAIGGSLVALPLVLPSSVLGFYLLIGLSPFTPSGESNGSLGLGLRPFSFGGMVLGCSLWSLPFVVLPLQRSFEAVSPAIAEAAAMLRTSPRDIFLRVTLPMARDGYLCALVLGAAHTVGVFGLALVAGGDIPSETQVVSQRLFHHVNLLEYAQAHRLAALLAAFGFGSLLLLHLLMRRGPRA